MAAKTGPPNGTENALSEAYLTLQTSKEGPGRKEQVFDKLSNTITSTSDSPNLTFLNNFYAANSSVINSAVAGLGSLDNKTVDAAITGFSESVKVVMNGLDALGQVHPFVSVAVVAFKLVITLDLTRRQNNQKVMAVKIQMQKMMCTLFQLRRIKDPDEIGPDGTVLKDRFQPLMVQIAQDIKECGSACDVYLKKSFIAKTLKSKIYEGRLADYAAKFMDYAEQLDKALTVHIALGVDTANVKLDGQSAQLASIQGKLDMLSNVFRRLDTPREREVMDFIEENGGPKAIVERNDLVEKLVKKSGETIAKLADKNLTSRSDIDSVKEKLKKELSEDVDLALKRNFSLFDRKLEIQSRNIADALEKQGQFIATVLAQGTHDKIKDIDLQNLWREMGWKGSVKARHFVLALRDYFTDQFNTATPFSPAGDTLMIDVYSPDKLLTPIELAIDPNTPHLPGLHDDEWALDYINVAHLQSILEAIDDDGTGFISIKEANNFAMSRPKGWSLLHWIAFWAKGWEMSLADYENKIFLILKEMDKLHHEVLPENRYYVDTYLRENTIIGIELVLRSAKTSTDYSHICPELTSLTEAYTSVEEERLRLNLENIGYDMDSVTTVNLITGPGRIERFLFPLLYLTLRRHLEVFHYACRHVVDSEEFSHMSTTIVSLFDLVQQRIDSLGAIYKQVHVDLHAHLENFALGMFHDFAVSQFSYGSRESVITGWKDTSKTKNESDDNTICDDPENAKPIFSSDRESQDTYRSQWKNWPPHSFDDDPLTGDIYGYWTGHFWSQQGDSIALCVLGLTHLKLDVNPDDNSLLTGFAVTHSGQLDLCGRRRSVEDKGEDRGYEQIDVLMWFDDGFSVRLVGSLRQSDETLIGKWATFYEKEEAMEIYERYPFDEDESQPGAVVDGHETVDQGEEVQDVVEGTTLEEDSQDDVEQATEGDTAAVEEEEPNNQPCTGAETQPESVDIETEDQTQVTENNDDSNIASGPVGEAEQNATEEEAPTMRSFVFRRNPAEVCKFRDLLYEDQNKAKARWNFLRESVLHLVRQRLWSWKQIISWGNDRRKFLDLYKRNWLLGTCDFMTPNPLTMEERAALYDLKWGLPPSNIRICVETLRWSLYRLPFHYGITCDGCHHRLIEPRFICLTCIDPDMSNSFDLCSQCIDGPVQRHDFTHTPDHTIIKCRQYIQKYFFAWVINEAQLMTTRLKKTFTEIMDKEGEGDAHGGEHTSMVGHAAELFCGCCAKPVRIPCWICITCAPETYICEECEEKELPILKGGPGSSIHRVDHSLLRIHNLEPVYFEKENIEATVARINALETDMNLKFAALESTLETRISSLESKVDERLASFETLLRKIALTLGVPGSDLPASTEPNSGADAAKETQIAKESHTSKEMAHTTEEPIHA